MGMPKRGATADGTFQRDRVTLINYKKRKLNNRGLNGTPQSQMNVIDQSTSTASRNSQSHANHSAAHSAMNEGTGLFGKYRPPK